MTFHGLIWSFSVFWTAVYAIRASRRRRRASLLPGSYLPVLPQHNGPFGTSKTCKVSVQNFHLKIETRRFNDSHDDLVEFLADPRNKQVQRALRVFYNIGVVFGAIGMGVGLGFLLYTCGQFLWNVWPNDATDRGLLIHSKRDEVRAEVNEVQPSPGIAINPLIPGVTVPWSHLPALLLALFVAQCIHEAGHAVAAAVDGVSLHSVGASITIMLPSAFVSLSPSLSSMAATTRLRVIAAGAWHNLVFFMLIWLSYFANLERIWTLVGWENISGSGVIVLEVESDSALNYHLNPGMIIVGLDDTVLASETPPEKVWARYLHSDNRPTKGWCIDAAAFYDQPNACCISRTDVHAPAAHLSCFEPLQQRSLAETGHCLDPVTILAPTQMHRNDTTSFARCSSRSECRSSGGIGAIECVKLDERENLLRIITKPAIWELSETGDSETTILWSGPRAEIWEQVSVGTLSPRSKYLPLSLPGTFTLFSYYLSTLSFSLYVFNLFALPFLDGSHFLSALISLMQPKDGLSDDSIPLSAASNAESGLDTSRIRHSRVDWKFWLWHRRARLEWSIRHITIALMTLTTACILFSSIK